jgi:DNA-binding NarL/FixJ family response regulator
VNASTDPHSLSPPCAARPATVVMVVDDAPQSLGLVCQTLEEDGYTVVIARDGESALTRLQLVTPDVILLDALMPGLSGFETCRRIKQDPALQHIPVIFMTGLSETVHIVEAFEAGGVDYVVKPVRAAEVLVRLSTHLRNARAVRLAREAVDVAGHGVLLIDAQGRIGWRSPQAAAWLQEFFPNHVGELPADSQRWLIDADLGVAHLVQSPTTDRTLRVRHLGPVGLGERMLLLQLHRQRSNPGSSPTDGVAGSRVIEAHLTPRETEVLSWVAKGKTNRDVADILGMSPRTVNKHLEHVFEKLGVETRAAATALASREMG